MTRAEVLAWLEANRDDRGVAHWEKLGPRTEGLKSCGIGLTRLRKFAKQVGRDHRLALRLWDTDHYEAKVVALLIDEPDKITRQQAEEQVEGVGAGMLSHVFSSCDATLPKAPFATDLAREWVRSKDELRRRCGYGLVYELSKDKRNKVLTEEYFLDCVQRIRAEIGAEEASVRMAMGGALMGIGKRSRSLNQEAIKVARSIGPIDSGEPNCEPMDVLKHLTSEHLRKRLAT